MKNPDKKGGHAQNIQAILAGKKERDDPEYVTKGALLRAFDKIALKDKLFNHELASLVPAAAVRHDKLNEHFRRAVHAIFRGEQERRFTDEVHQALQTACETGLEKAGFDGIRHKKARAKFVEAMEKEIPSLTRFTPPEKPRDKKARIVKQKDAVSGRNYISRDDVRKAVGAKSNSRREDIRQAIAKKPPAPIASIAPPHPDEIKYQQEMDEMDQYEAAIQARVAGQKQGTASKSGR